LEQAMATIETRQLIDSTGRPYHIRVAQPADAATVLEYIREILHETSFFVLESDELAPTVDEEESWIRDHLEHAGKLFLLAEAGTSILGNARFEPGPYRRIAHRGTLSIAVRQQWQGRGVGTHLLDTLLKWATANPLIEKVCLEVFAANHIAKRLYEKMGFVEEGRRLRDVKRGPNDYDDSFLMSRFVT
jgi:RimJ/RimL family protein N-acetyltransferase